MIRKVLLLIILPVLLLGQVTIQFKWDKYIERTDTPKHYSADSAVTALRIYSIKDGNYTRVADNISKYDTTYSLLYTTADSIVYFVMTAVNPNEESGYSNVASVVLKHKPVVVVFGTPRAPILQYANKIDNIQNQSISIVIEITDIYDTFTCTILNNTIFDVTDITLSVVQRIDWVSGVAINPDVGGNNDGKSSKTIKILDTISPHGKLIFTGDFDGRGEPIGTISYNGHVANIIKNNRIYSATITL